jgi:hypothetical protein
MDDFSGWIKLHRNILQWEWWDDKNTRDLFLVVLLLANHKEKKWRGEKIPAGSFITSLPSLSSISGLTIQEVRTSLSKLKSTGEITDKSTNSYRIITICNYAKYQIIDNQEQQAKQQAANTQSTGNQQAINSNQECNNVRSIDKEIDKPIGLSTKNDSSQVNLFGDTDEPLPPKRKSRKEKPFVPPTEEDVQAYLNEKGITDIDAHYFVNKYESVGWMNGGQPVKNWKALVNTWDRRARGNQTISSNQSPSTKRVDIYGKEIHENLQ